jgi:hypothetical protein
MEDEKSTVTLTGSPVTEPVSTENQAEPINNNPIIKEHNNLTNATKALCLDDNTSRELSPNLGEANVEIQNPLTRDSNPKGMMEEKENKENDENNTQSILETNETNHQNTLTWEDEQALNRKK